MTKYGNESNSRTLLDLGILGSLYGLLGIGSTFGLVITLLLPPIEFTLGRVALIIVFASIAFAFWRRYRRDIEIHRVKLSNKYRR